MREVISLYTWRDILTSKTQEHQEESEQIGLAEFPPVYYIYLICFVLSYISTAVYSSSDLA